MNSVGKINKKKTKRKVTKKNSGNNKSSEKLGEIKNALSPKEIKQNEFIIEFIAAGGRFKVACNKLGVGVSTYYDWLKEPGFASRLHEAKQEWESVLHAKAMQLALEGNTTMICFLLKFLNPFYDDRFREKILAEQFRQTVYENSPIPEPRFLPPEIPERFRGASDSSGDSDE